MKEASCEWCLAPVMAPVTFNRIRQSIYCSAKCRVNNHTFLHVYSDEEINRRARRILSKKG